MKKDPLKLHNKKVTYFYGSRKSEIGEGYFYYDEKREIGYFVSNDTKYNGSNSSLILEKFPGYKYTFSMSEFTNINLIEENNEMFLIY